MDVPDRAKISDMPLERDPENRGYGLGLRPPRKFRQLAGCRDGSVAVEFALVCIPFIAILIAILETGLVFLAQQVLQTATTDASRLIMTGQAQATTASQFHQTVCNKAGTLFSCAGIYVNVQTFGSFSNVAPLNPLQNGAFNNTMNYTTGSSGNIMMVQVFYQWPVVFAPLGFSVANNGTNRLLVGTAVFRNEPF
jgi:Flp pilus assembly protein TadG